MRLFTGRLNGSWNRANWDPTLLRPSALPDARTGVTFGTSTFTITSTGAATNGQAITFTRDGATIATLTAGTEWAASGTVGTQAANIRDAINAAVGLSGIASATASSGVTTVTITLGATGSPLGVTENCDNVALGGNCYSSATGTARMQVSQLDDPRGASIFSGVRATASRQPAWVYNSGQSYLEALGSTSNLSDSSTGASFAYNTPRTLGGIFYYPAAATTDGAFIGTGDAANNFHTTSIGAVSNTVLQFAAATTNNGTNGLLVRKTVSNLQGTWFTWFATFDGTDADGVRLYLNTVLQTSLTVTWNTLSSGTAPDSSVQIIGIGAGNALAGMRHAASILDTKVWTEADIARFHRWAKRRWPSFNLP